MIKNFEELFESLREEIKETIHEEPEKSFDYHILQNHINISKERIYSNIEQTKIKTHNYLIQNPLVLQQ